MKLLSRLAAFLFAADGRFSPNSISMRIGRTLLMVDRIRHHILQSNASLNRRQFLMSRFNPVAIPLFCLIAACSPVPDSSSGRSSGPAIQIANQDVARSAITAEKIVRDVVRRVVMITQVAGDSTPTEWTFDADEFRQVEILDSEITQTSAVITVFMTTRNNPGPDEDAVQVSGKLKLRYQRKGAEWVLATIENLSFRYTVGIST